MGGTGHIRLRFLRAVLPAWSPRAGKARAWVLSLQFIECFLPPGLHICPRDSVCRRQFDEPIDNVLQGKLHSSELRNLNLPPRSACDLRLALGAMVSSGRQAGKTAYWRLA